MKTLGNLLLVLVLVSGFRFSANSQTNLLSQNLLRAVKANQLDSVKLLVDLGADVNYCDSLKAPVVMWAALKGDLDMVKYLVSKGADVRKKGIIYSEKGDYIFGNISGIAVVRQDLLLLRYLIEDCGIPYNDRELDSRTMTEAGWTASIYAIHLGEKAILQYLIAMSKTISPEYMFFLSYGLDIDFDSLIIRNLKLMEGIKGFDSVKIRILDLAIINNRFNLLPGLLQFPTAINSLNRDSLTYLALCATNATLDNAIYLVSKGADAEHPCKDGMTPLFFAIQSENKPLIKFLIEKGADINHQDNKGRTPLFYSILLFKPEVADFLVSLGADKAKSDYSFERPADIAWERGYKYLALKLDKNISESYKGRNPKPKLFMPPEKITRSLQDFSANDKLLLTTSASEACLWDMNIGKILRKFNNARYAFLSNNYKTVTLVNDNFVEVWEIQRNEILYKKRINNWKNIWYQDHSSDNDLIQFQVDVNNEYWPQITESFNLRTCSLKKVAYGDKKGFFLNDSIYLTSKDDSIFAIKGNVAITKPVFLLKTPMNFISNWKVSNDMRWVLKMRTDYKQRQDDPFAISRDLILVEAKSKDSAMILSAFPDKLVLRFLFSPKSNSFTFIQEGKLTIYPLPLKSKKPVVIDSSHVYSFLYSPSGDTIVISYDDGSLAYCNLILEEKKVYNISAGLISRIDEMTFISNESIMVHSIKPAFYRVSIQNNDFKELLSKLSVPYYSTTLNPRRSYEQKPSKHCV